MESAVRTTNHRTTLSASTRHTLSVEAWRKEISKVLSVVGPWAPSTASLPTVTREELPENLHALFDKHQAEGQGAITVFKLELDNRAAYFFEWPHAEKGVSFDIRDATGHHITPQRDKKAEAEMDTQYALSRAMRDEFRRQRPRSKDTTVDQWLRLYNALNEDTGTSEFLDAPESWKLNPKQLEKLGDKAVGAFKKFGAVAAYRNPLDGSVLLEKATQKRRYYLVLSNLGQALQQMKI